MFIQLYNGFMFCLYLDKYILLCYFIVGGRVRYVEEHQRNISEIKKWAYPEQIYYLSVISIFIYGYNNKNTWL